MSSRTLLTITIIAAVAIVVIGVAFLGTFKEYTEPSMPGGKSKIGSIVNPSTNMMVYENPAWGVYLEYPAAWKKTEGRSLLGNEQVEFSSPIDLSLRMTYYYTRVDSSIESFDESFKKDLEERLTTYAHLSNTRITTQNATLGSNPALRIDFIGNTEELEYRVVTIRMIRGDRMYDITYSMINDSQFAGYEAGIQKMLDSLKFASPKESYAAYENRDLGLRLKHPESWMKNEESWSQVLGFAPELNLLFPSGVGFSVPNHIAGVAVAVVTSKAPMSDDEWKGAIIAATKGYAYESVLVESGNTTLSGNPAYRMVFSYRLRADDPEHKVTLLLTTKGNRTYLIGYNAWDEKAYDYYSGIAGEMMDSFEITN